MGAQTINFDESAQGYDFLEIEFTQYTDWRRHICKIPIGAQSQVQCLSIQSGQYYGNTRVIEGSTSTTIEIDDGILNALNGTLVPDNNSCLIERIWAVK